MKFACFMLVFPVILGASCAYAHGEDKPGPHGGFIRMPSNYHTEVLLNDNRSVKIYLLDLHWKNPSLRDSEVRLNHRAGKAAQPVAAQCEPQVAFYLCRFPATVNLTRPGRLQLASKREGQKGVEVSYPLPLKLEKPAATPPPESGPSHGHGGHH